MRMILVLVFCFLQNSALAQSPTPEQWDSKKWLSYFTTQAKQYVITGEQNKEPLDFVPEPLLNWGDPARVGQQGGLFVWTRDGRPEVIGSIFKFPTSSGVRIKHAMHSLSEEPLQASFGSQLAWSPQEAGVKWFEPSPAPKPAASERAWRSQMRGIARRYKLTMTDPNRVSTNLRLIPQPLVQYKSKGKRILSGAIYAYAVGTDPEAMLVVELVESDDTPTFRCSFARSHYFALKATNTDEKEAWNLPLDSMYFASIGDERHIHKTYNSYRVPLELP